MTARRSRRSIYAPRSGRRWWLVLVGVPVALLLVLVAAWAIDTGAFGGDVVRNVGVRGNAVGGLASENVLSVVGDVAANWGDVPVEIVAPDATYHATAGQLGLQVDEQATVDAVLDVGHSGSLLARPFAWFRSFFSDRAAPVQFRVDTAVLSSAVAALQGDALVPPVEPAVVLADAGFEAVPGTDGEGIDVEALAAALPAAAASGEPVTVDAVTGAIPPTIADEQAAQLAADANRMTGTPLAIAIGDIPVTVPPEILRTWFAVTTSSDGLGLDLDEAKVAADLQALAPDANRPAVSARFDLVDGHPTVVPGADGTACCQPDAADLVRDALEKGTGTVALALVTTPPALSTDQANALGIVQEVGQPDAFGPTTHHAAGEPRVTNIHRIADIVRGAVIKPGETFSVNGYVGERTAAKGFVDAPVIYQGTFQHDIGGGVSQFATTLFNAALFAGLDFAAYQSHSIEISRYPKGHEATISYPQPDLQITNTTPYGILIWPTYTSSSITVHLYSTHYVDVSLGALSSSPQGNCTRWTTPRTRSYVDGRVENDSVHAVYRPGEGIDC